MRLDTQSLFSDTQKLSGASATGTNVLDIGKAGVAEHELFVVARFDTDTHGCVKVTIQGSVDGTTFVDVASAAVTDTTAGAGVNIRLPQACPRYLNAVYNAATSGTLKGNVTCGITLQAPSPRGARISDFAANV